MIFILMAALCATLLIDDYVRSANGRWNSALSQVSECSDPSDHMVEEDMLENAIKVKDLGHFHMPDYICYCELKRVEIQYKLKESIQELKKNFNSDHGYCSDYFHKYVRSTILKRVYSLMVTIKNEIVIFLAIFLVKKIGFHT